MARLFISQAKMDKWLEEGKVHLVGQVMTLPALGRSFRLRPAVSFLRIVSDEVDRNLLIGRVKTREQLNELGAEIMGGSAVVRDSAYECEPGFVGEVTGPPAPGSGIYEIPE